MHECFCFGPAIMLSTAGTKKNKATQVSRHGMPWRSRSIFCFGSAIMLSTVGTKQKCSSPRRKMPPGRIWILCLRLTQAKNHRAQPMVDFVLAAGGGKHKMLGQACQHSFAAFLFRAGNHVVNSGHETKMFEPSQKNATRQDLDFVLAADGGKRKIIVPSQWFVLAAGGGKHKMLGQACQHSFAWQNETRVFRDRPLSKHFVLAAVGRKHKIHHWLGTMIFRLPPPAASTNSKSCLAAFFCEGSKFFVSCPLLTT